MGRPYFLLLCFFGCAFKATALKCSDDGLCYFDLDLEFVNIVETPDICVEFVKFQSEKYRKCIHLDQFDLGQYRKLKSLDLYPGNKIKARHYGNFIELLEIDGEKIFPRPISCDGVHLGANSLVTFAGKCSSEDWTLDDGYSTNEGLEIYDMGQLFPKSAKGFTLKSCINADQFYEEQFKQLVEAFDDGKLRLNAVFNITINKRKIEFCENKFVNAVNHTAIDEMGKKSLEDRHNDYLKYQEEQEKLTCGRYKGPCYIDIETEYLGEDNSTFQDYSLIKPWAPRYLYGYDRIASDMIDSTHRKALIQAGPGHKAKFRNYFSFFELLELDGKPISLRLNSCDGIHLGANFNITFKGICDDDEELLSFESEEIVHTSLFSCISESSYRSKKQLKQIKRAFANGDLKIGDKLNVTVINSEVEFCANDFISSYKYFNEDEDSLAGLVDHKNIASEIKHINDTADQGNKLNLTESYTFICNDDDNERCYDEGYALFEGYDEDANCYNITGVRLAYDNECYASDYFDVGQAEKLKTVRPGEKIKLRYFERFFELLETENGDKFPEPVSCNGKHFGINTEIEIVESCVFDGITEKTNSFIFQIPGNVPNYWRTCWFKTSSSTIQLEALKQRIENGTIHYGDKFNVTIAHSDLFFCKNDLIPETDYADFNARMRAFMKVLYGGRS